MRKLKRGGGGFLGMLFLSLGALLACNKKRKFYFIKSSSIKMPIKLNSSINFSEIILKLDLIQYKKDVCYIPGIQHFLSKERFTILEEKKVLRNKASGVISYKNISADTYNINPIVYVRDTKTFYEESSCASGTLALAYMLYEKKGIKKLNVLQPSGFILKTSISKNEIKLGGQIVSIKKETILI